MAWGRIPLSYNLRSLVVRKTTTIASALGIALVVFVLASSLMLSKGIERTLGKSGRADTAIVLRKGSDAELASSIEEPQVGLILAQPGVKSGDALARGVKEIVVVIALEKLGTDGGVSNVQIRGVPDNVMKFRPEARLVAGRPARPGTDEAIVGRAVRGRYQGIELGQRFELRKNRNIEIVGVFAAGGSSFESEVWADLDTVRSSFGREGLVSSVRVRLESPSKFDGFQAAIGADKQLGLEALREDVYYEKQSEGTARFIRMMGIVIAVFFSVGAMIGATITMYASIASRRREIGTLRALGFSRFAILRSFLVEALILALGGGLVGTLCSLGMGFVQFSMMNFASWSEIVFRFEPTPSILISALVASAVMGLIGGFSPAIRAAFTSPIQAMRG